MEVQEHDLTEVQRSREAIEALEPSVTERKVTFNWTLPNGEPTRKEYLQAQLGMFPTQEFTTMVTEILDSFVEGEMGMKIGELFRGDVAMPVTFDADTVNETISENLQIIKALVKLVRILPDFQLDIICLSLGIPRRERAWAKEQLQEPPSRGGLTVTEGFDLLIVFIRQNASLVKETVTGKARELVDVFRLEILGQDPTTEEETAQEEQETDTAGGMPSSTFLPATQASA